MKAPGDVAHIISIAKVQFVLFPLCQDRCCLHDIVYGDAPVDKIYHTFHGRIDVMIEFLKSFTEVV